MYCSSAFSYQLCRCTKVFSRISVRLASYTFESFRPLSLHPFSKRFYIILYASLIIIICYMNTMVTNQYQGLLLTRVINVNK